MPSKVPSPTAWGSRFNRQDCVGSGEASEIKLIMPPSNHADAVGNLDPQHLSQWKPSRNQQAIERYTPGNGLVFERARAGYRAICSRNTHRLNRNQIQRLNLAHFPWFASRCVSGRVEPATEGQEKKKRTWPQGPKMKSLAQDAKKQPSMRVPGPASMSGARALAILLPSCCC